jgi:hypothetical protein
VVVNFKTVTPNNIAITHQKTGKINEARSKVAEALK